MSPASYSESQMREARAQIYEKLGRPDKAKEVREAVWRVSQGIPWATCNGMRSNR